MSKEVDEIIKMKLDIVKAGKDAVKELIAIAKEKVIKENDMVDDEGKPIDKNLAADRLKNAAATKKLAIFDALEILSKIEETEQEIKEHQMGGGQNYNSLAESNAK